MAQTLCKTGDVSADTGHEVVVEGTDGPVHIALFLIDGAVRAYLNICPHQGRAMNIAPGEFVLGPRGEIICPHHGASFESGTGACISGPCQGASLKAVEIVVHDDQVRLLKLPFSG